ncbi:PAS domain-containing sensor histidine kinase [Chelativorans sp. SCAU2101]|uniref:histidine kinase n=1 Tax=Chelativorans petroleitrophicus TaxID=2975484 RepID=A0A9X2XA86_9HYPH|nr:PAS domain-containing sensor histidine kinase [Chelativorans petroleitrophicus]MCT8991648.1 PAS domain-containing sensor histidine kinase [Chelativorans petroleitrophicus]
MSTRATPSKDWVQDIEAACERLLHPSVTAGEERARQRRLLQVLLAGPVLAALVTAQLGMQATGTGTAFAAVAIVFGISLVLPFGLIATAARRIVEPAALVIAAMATAVMIAAAGGLASPLAASAAAIAIEAGWVARTRRAIGVGVAVSGAAVAASAELNGLILPEAAPSAWHWIMPLIYAATVLARMPLMRLGRAKEVAAEAAPSLEDMPATAVLHLQDSGEVSHASEKVEELLGVAPEMVLGSGLFDRIHVADRVAWLTALSDLRGGETARSLRLRIRVPAPAGLPSEALYRNFACDVIARAKGAGFAAILRDDAARRELEEALAIARKQAEETAIARDHLLASVGHELRTPLNAIVGFSDVLANGMFGDFAHAKQREYVELIHQAGSHLLAVVNAILDVSKLQSGAYSLNAEPFRLDDAVRMCIAVTAGQVQAKTVEVKADIAEDVGTVHCDRRALQQVLINLLSNAMKFTPSGEVKVTARRDGKRLEMTVSDTGIGMSADDLQRVGQPFTRVDNDYTRQYEGTGLGLSLVKGLVRLQGGSLSIESTPGAGTRVHISLPADGADGEGEEEKAGAAGWETNRKCEWNYDALRKTA